MHHALLNHARQDACRIELYSGLVYSAVYSGASKNRLCNIASGGWTPPRLSLNPNPSNKLRAASPSPRTWGRPGSLSRTLSGRQVHQETV